MINCLLWFFGIKQRPSRKNLITEISVLNKRYIRLQDSYSSLWGEHEDRGKTIQVLENRITELLFPPKRKRGRPRKVVA